MCCYITAYCECFDCALWHSFWICFFDSLIVFCALWICSSRCFESVLWTSWCFVIIHSVLCFESAPIESFNILFKSSSLCFFWSLFYAFLLFESFIFTPVMLWIFYAIRFHNCSNNVLKSAWGAHLGIGARRFWPPARRTTPRWRDLFRWAPLEPWRARSRGTRRPWRAHNPSFTFFHSSIKPTWPKPYQVFFPVFSQSPATGKF